MNRFVIKNGTGLYFKQNQFHYNWMLDIDHADLFRTYQETDDVIRLKKLFDQQGRVVPVDVIVKEK